MKAAPQLVVRRASGYRPEAAEDEVPLNEVPPNAASAPEPETPVAIEEAEELPAPVSHGRSWRWALGGGVCLAALALAGWLRMQDKPEPTTAAPAASTTAAAAVRPALKGNSIDELVSGQLAFVRVEPAGICSDEVFVRRAFLDVIGTLPTADEARAFLSSKDPEKRRVLIDRLLEREEFADYWAMKWGDLLRIKAEFPINLWPNAAQAYHHWVRASIAANKPYDQFARELLTSSGSNFRVGPVNFYRAMQDRTPGGIASTVALTLMGTRTDAWPSNRLAGMAAFFSQVGYKPSREWKEEIVFWDPMGSSRATNAASPVSPALAEGALPLATFPDGQRVALPSNRDPREAFADWLIDPKNPWFTRSIANRVWSWLLGRGIIEPADDLRENNPPGNPELLAYLEKELIASHYDLKQLYRLILNSKAYQFSSQVAPAEPKAEASFASYPLRRLDAEVLIDAINKITGTSELYTSPIPEPFTYIPTDTPAIALADGSITSPFLALFGRSARATGTEDERVNRVLPAQSLHLLNSSHIERKLEQGSKLRAIFESRKTPAQIVEELYLTVLSRFPTPEEVKNAEAYVAPGPAPKSGKSGKTSAAVAGKKRDDWVDVTWALINSDEFLYRH